MLYEALTGRAPFSGSYEDIIERKRTLAPTPPRALDASTPAELSELCVDLLAIDPAKRPSSADIRSALGFTSEVALDTQYTQYVASFVGREPHLAALRGALGPTDELHA